VDSNLRLSMIMDDWERRDVERLEASRRETPETWRSQERARLESNRQRRRLNNDLRARGLKGVPLLPSLDARIEKLQRAGNWRAAETERFEPSTSRIPRKTGRHSVRTSKGA
jgi:hypothetical protein